MTDKGAKDQKKILRKGWRIALAAAVLSLCLAYPAMAEMQKEGAPSSGLSAGWNKSGDRWWYAADDTGTDCLKDGWYTIDGAMYCFDREGWLLENTVTPDDKLVGEDGVFLGDAGAPAGMAQRLIVVGEGGDFPTIQGAIDYLAYHELDRRKNTWTIRVLPGTYPRFTTKNAKTGFHDPRYFSIEGTDREQCIIKDGSGEYLTPAADICLNGSVKNLQFIATHEAAPPLMNRADDSRKAYAVHMDFGTQVLTFENCSFTSCQAPGVGAGISAGEQLTFRNCEFKSLGDVSRFSPNNLRNDYTWLTECGALYVHSDMPGGGLALLRLENCSIYSKNASKSLWISQPDGFWDPEKTTMQVTLIGNTASGDRAGDKIEIEHKWPGMDIMPESTGNSFDSQLWTVPAETAAAETAAATETETAAATETAPAETAAAGAF